MLCTSLLLVLYAGPKGMLHVTCPVESCMIICSPMGIVEIAVELPEVDPAMQTTM
jgi:hypothetical protein